MGDNDDVKPSEQRRQKPSATMAPEKGPGAAAATRRRRQMLAAPTARRREMLDDDPELGSSVLGQTTGSEEPATQSGVDLQGGDNADATTDGGPETEEGVEPDQRDAARPAQAVDRSLRAAPGQIAGVGCSPAGAASPSPSAAPKRLTRSGLVRRSHSSTTMPIRIQAPARYGASSIGCGGRSSTGRGKRRSRSRPAGAAHRGTGCSSLRRLDARART